MTLAFVLLFSWLFGRPLWLSPRTAPERPGCLSRFVDWLGLGLEGAPAAA